MMFFLILKFSAFLLRYLKLAKWGDPVSHWGVLITISSAVRAYNYQVLVVVPLVFEN